MLDKTSKKRLPHCTDAAKLANEFNNYYVEKIEKLRQTIPKNANNYHDEIKQFEGEKLAEFEPTTDEELKEIIAKYGVKASAGGSSANNSVETGDK